jgi:hypothetical protein
VVAERGENLTLNLRCASDSDHIVAAANGSNFAASLSLTTLGNRQSVAIRPQGIDVTGVSITLNRLNRQ